MPRLRTEVAESIEAAPCPPPTGRYFALAFAWSWAWWAAAAGVGGVDELPGGVLFLAGGAGPLVAAAVVVAGHADDAYRRAFVRRVVEVRRVPLRWWLVVAAIGFLPKVAAAAAGAVAGIDTEPARAGGAAVVGVVVFALVAGLAEEPGWRGVAGDGLRPHRSRARVGLIVGGAWAVWHLPLYVVPGTFHHDVGFGTADFAAVTGALVPLAVLYVWAQGHVGESILAAVVLHAAGNVAGEVLPTASATRFVELAVLVALAAVVTAADARGDARRPTPRPPTLGAGAPRAT